MPSDQGVDPDYDPMTGGKLNRDSYTPMEQRFLYERMELHRRARNLSWSQVYDEIRNANHGIEFHPKYKQRLFRGELGVQTVKNVHRWILAAVDARYDLEMVPLSDDSTTGTVATPYIIRWHPVDGAQLTDFLDRIKPGDFPISFRRDELKVEVWFAPFLEKTLVRIRTYKVLPFSRFLFVVDDRQKLMFCIDPGSMYRLRTVGINTVIDEATIIPLLSFLCEEHLSLKSFNLLLTPHAIDIDPTEPSAISILQNYRHLYTAPAIAPTSTGGFIVECDVQTKNRIKRTKFLIEESGAVTFEHKVELLTFPAKKKTTPHKVVPRSLEPVLIQPLDISPFANLKRKIHDLLSQVYTGLTFVLVEEILKTRVDIVVGATYTYYHDPANNVVTFFVPSDLEKSVEFLSLEFVYAMRVIEQYSINYAHADDTKDTQSDYTEKMHVKNLDATIFMCKVYIELRDGCRSGVVTNCDPVALENAIDTFCFRGLVDAYENGASSEELWQVYWNMTE